MRDWAGSVTSPTVVICQKGQKLSQGTAAFLRLSGSASETLAGGFEAWVKSGGLAVPEQIVGGAQPGCHVLDRDAGHAGERQIPGRLKGSRAEVLIGAG